MATSSIQYKIGLQSSQFASSVAGAVRKIASIGAAFFAVTGAVKLFQNAVADARELQQLANSTGESAGQLLILRQAFDDAGLGAGSMTQAITSLNKSLYMEAAPKAVQALSALGLSLDSLRAMSSTSQFEAIGQAIAALENHSHRAAVAMMIFGDSGQQFLQLFSNPNAIRSASAALGTMPRMMGSLAESASRVAIAQGRISTQFQGMVLGISQGLLPVIEAANQKLLSLDLPLMGLKIGTTVDVAIRRFFEGDWDGIADAAANVLGDAFSLVCEEALGRAALGITQGLGELLADVLVDPISAGGGALLAKATGSQASFGELFSEAHAANEAWRKEGRGSITSWAFPSAPATSSSGKSFSEEVRARVAAAQSDISAPSPNPTQKGGFLPAAFAAAASPAQSAVSDAYRLGLSRFGGFSTSASDANSKANRALDSIDRKLGSIDRQLSRVQPVRI